MASPLEQFEIKPIVALPKLAGMDISYTNSALFMTLAVLVSSIMMIATMRGRAVIPGRGQALAEIYYTFVANLVRDVAGADARRYFPLIFTIFTFVLFGNLLGMLPFSFTFTSHIAVTFALAASMFVFITALGFVKHGLKFFGLFLPSGSPWYVAPVLVPIEVFSYFVRPLTLSVRLFANMLAGHILLKVIVGFVAAMGVAGVLPLALTMVFIGFEVFVACLQAYIFALLTCVYLKDAIHLH